MRKILFLALLASTIPTFAFASPRRFTYVYEAATAAPGTFELENWITWKTRRADDRDFRVFDFRHEVEFGITDRLQAAIYLADWSYRKGRTVEDAGATYTASAIELIYGLTNAQTAPLGSALYGELRVGDDLVQLESKIIIEKDAGRWTFAYNATLEAEWEGDELEERSGELQQALGASYEITPRVLVGAELLHEIPLPQWERAGKSVVLLGPNVSLRYGDWWATTTALAQLAGPNDEPDFQLRTIVGYSF